MYALSNLTYLKSLKKKMDYVFKVKKKILSGKHKTMAWASGKVFIAILCYREVLDSKVALEWSISHQTTLNDCVYILTS